MTTLENRIELIKGDKTKVKADAIVNAANSLLMGGRAGAQRERPLSPWAAI